MVALSDVNSDIVEQYSYDIFGQPTIWNMNSLQMVNSSTVGNPYFFTGRRFDDEIGLYYYRARYYSPYIGRFLQPDPVAMYMQFISTKHLASPADGEIPGKYLSNQTVKFFPVELNLYNYVLNNPINWVDPSGKSISVASPAACVVCGICFGAAGGACLVLCIEDPTWDCPSDSFGDCMYKCLKSIPSAAPWFTIGCSIPCVICNPKITI